MSIKKLGQIIIDDEDLTKIQGYRWTSVRGYAAAFQSSRPRTVYLHRIIMDAKPGQVIDHINRDPKDNRKSNLRFVTQQENCLNSSINNNPPYIHWHKLNKRWRITRPVNGKPKYIASFKTKQEALESGL